MDSCGERDLRRFEGVVRGEVNRQEEYASLKDDNKIVKS